MKIYLTFLCLIFSFICFSNDTILFIDTNNNEKEIQTARIEARKLGKNFISYPKKGETFDITKAKDIISKTPFSTFILSGHNGGGDINGDNGYISHEDVKIALEKNPLAKQNAKTIMLLGCNTSNPNQILKWQEIFPNMSILAGYNGTAPAQDKEAGHSYIREILQKEDYLYRLADKEDLKKALKNLKHIYYLEAGIYINKINCLETDQKESSEYIYRSKLPKLHERFSEFNFAECNEKKSEIQNTILPLYVEYFSGKKSLNNSVAAEEMRYIYNFVHQYEHCIDTDFSMEAEDGSYYSLHNWETLGLLRFWKEFSSNNFKLYQDAMKSEYLDLENLFKNPENLERKINEDYKIVQDKINFLSQVNELTKEDFLSRIQKQIYEKQAEFQKLIDEQKKIDDKLKKLVNKINNHPSMYSITKELEYYNDLCFPYQSQKCLDLRLSVISNIKDKYKLTDQDVSDFNEILLLSSKANKLYIQIDKIKYKDLDGLESLKQTVNNFSMDTIRSNVNDHIEAVKDHTTKDVIAENYDRIKKNLPVYKTILSGPMDRKILSKTHHALNQLDNSQFPSIYSYIDKVYYLQGSFKLHEDLSDEEINKLKFKRDEFQRDEEETNSFLLFGGLIQGPESETLWDES